MAWILTFGQWPIGQLALKMNQEEYYDILTMKRNPLISLALSTNQKDRKRK